MSKIYLQEGDKIYITGNYIAVGISGTTSGSHSCNDSTIHAITKDSSGVAINTGKIGISNLSRDEVENISDVYQGELFKDGRQYNVYYEMRSGKYWHKSN